MEPEHKHRWSTRYVNPDGDNRHDCANGMECGCGARLDQDTVIDIVNAAQPPADYDSEGWVIKT